MVIDPLFSSISDEPEGVHADNEEEALTIGRVILLFATIMKPILTCCSVNF